MEFALPRSSRVREIVVVLRATLGQNHAQIRAPRQMGHTQNHGSVGPPPPTRQNPSKPAVIPGPYSANRVKIIDFRPKNGIFLRAPRQNHASGRAPLVAPSSNARGRQNHGGRSGPRQNHASGGAPRATVGHC